MAKILKMRHFIDSINFLNKETTPVTAVPQPSTSNAVTTPIKIVKILQQSMSTLQKAHGNKLKKVKICRFAFLKFNLISLDELAGLQNRIRKKHPKCHKNI